MALGLDAVACADRALDAGDRMYAAQLLRWFVAFSPHQFHVLPMERMYRRQFRQAGPSNAAIKKPGKIRESPRTPPQPGATYSWRRDRDGAWRSVLVDPNAEPNATRREQHPPGLRAADMMPMRG